MLLFTYREEEDVYEVEVEEEVSRTRLNLQ